MERNCTDVWLFWHDVLCSAYQRGAVGAACVQRVIGLQCGAE